PEGVVEVRDAVRRVLDDTGATLVVVEHRVAVWRDLVDRVVVLSPDGVIADGHPDTVLVEHGQALASAGIWVPDYPPKLPARGIRPTSETLLETQDLAVGRERVAI